MWLLAPRPICVCLCALPFKMLPLVTRARRDALWGDQGLKGSDVLVAGCAPATWEVRTGLLFKPGHPPCGAVSASGSALGQLSVDCPLWISVLLAPGQVSAVISPHWAPSFPTSWWCSGGVT